MKEKLAKEILIIIFLIVLLIIYNLFPYFSTKIEYDSYNIIEFLSLVIINPISLGICGFIYGYKHGFSWFLSIILTSLFLPTVFLFFEIPYLFYMIVYIVFIISSELFGISISKLIKKP